MSIVRPSVDVAVDLHDDVAGHHAAGVGGGADHRGDDLEALGVVVDLDRHPDAAELPLDLPLERLPLRRVDVGRVLVEVAEHPPQGRLHQLAPADRADVVLLDLLDGVDEDPVELGHVVLRLRPLARLPGKPATGRSPSRSPASSGSASVEALLGGPVDLFVPASLAQTPA